MDKEKPLNLSSASSFSCFLGTQLGITNTMTQEEVNLDTRYGDEQKTLNVNNAELQSEYNQKHKTRENLNIPKTQNPGSKTQEP